jgi:hypothetical protein
MKRPGEVLFNSSAHAKPDKIGSNGRVAVRVHAHIVEGWCQMAISPDGVNWSLRAKLYRGKPFAVADTISVQLGNATLGAPHSDVAPVGFTWRGLTVEVR